MDHTRTKGEVTVLYQKLIEAWNHRNAKAMAELYTETGEQIGFDGSLMEGPEEMISELSEIFGQHSTPPFISKVKNVRILGGESAVLRAIVGMIPPGKTELDPELNAHQTLTAVKKEQEWKVELFQNTPAQYHGRPDLVEEMTEELKYISNQ
ncbi:SgcJ/EcaC family oxidoreductase [Halobacillus shinanisalinarum]|uniref:SgcJ/EcaC family oxidoreductase n=1 Tax=Halobacillus shinanisalinarum TaxID=2932258 RepID=A0ABY4H512_9BACI|nr:SgcJ/EcaC family oxidoreductase [Halobacillus shinanisalinarum]UOQ95301.1 SgcJ/EcaC family oxidoreductase [Halobacillus shinanisalinarum]